MAEVTELEERLTALGASIDWPRTPDLAARVGARIAPAAILRRPWFQSRWAIAAAVLLLAMAALIAYTPTRVAIANWINVHTSFIRVSELPTPSPQPSGPLGERLGLGKPTTLANAQSKVSWHIRVPTSLGQPDEVYVLLPADGGPPQGEVSLVYKARPGFKTSGQTGVAILITEADGTVDVNYFGKMFGSGTTIEEVTVNGHKGYWISGQPHDFFFIDADGNLRQDTMRLATNTLLIDDNGTLVRIEGDVTKAQALEIASSLT